VIQRGDFNNVGSKKVHRRNIFLITWIILDVIYLLWKANVVLSNHSFKVTITNLGQGYDT